MADIAAVQALQGPLNPNAPNYGEVGDIQQLKQGAPTGTPMTPPSGGTPGGVDLSSVTPLGAPSAMPDQHVTDGVTAKPGSPPSPQDQDRADIRNLDPSMVNAMLYQASQPGTSPTFQRYVRELYSNR
jgi:hypothetical protein